MPPFDSKLWVIARIEPVHSGKAGKRPTRNVSSRLCSIKRGGIDNMYQKKRYQQHSATMQRKAVGASEFLGQS